MEETRTSRRLTPERLQRVNELIEALGMVVLRAETLADEEENGWQPGAPSSGSRTPRVGPLREIARFCDEQRDRLDDLYA